MIEGFNLSYLEKPCHVCNKTQKGCYRKIDTDYYFCSMPCIEIWMDKYGNSSVYSTEYIPSWKPLNVGENFLYEVEMINQYRDINKTYLVMAPDGYTAFEKIDDWIKAEDTETYDNIVSMKARLAEVLH